MRPPPKAEQEPAAERPGAEPRPRRLPWADLLKRVFDAEVKVCGKFGGRRRVVAIIGEPKQARETLAELGLEAEPLRLAKARGPPVQLELAPNAANEGIDPVYPE